MTPADNFQVLKRKKTEHIIISHNLRNSEHQNIHVMLSYAKTANKKNTPSKVVTKSLLIIFGVFSGWTVFYKLQNCKKKKKNGAHKHCSHLKKLRASKYSRHVVLCNYNYTQKKTQLNHVRLKTDVIYCVFWVPGVNFSETDQLYS